MNAPCAAIEAGGLIRLPEPSHTGPSPAERALLWPQIPHGWAEQMHRVMRITNWDDHFEVDQSKKVSPGSRRWRCSPLRDGLAYRRLMQHEHGCEIYGIFHAICNVAAKMPTPGVLEDDDPLTFDDISLLTGVPTDKIERAVSLLESATIAWIETYEPNPDPIESESNADRMPIEPDTSEVGPRQDKTRGEERRRQSVGDDVQNLAAAAGISKTSAVPPETTPNDFLRCWSLWRKKKTPTPGLLLRMLQDHDYHAVRKLTTQIVRDAIQAGIVTHIRPPNAEWVGFSGGCTFNKHTIKTKDTGIAIKAETLDECEYRAEAA